MTTLTIDISDADLRLCYLALRNAHDIYEGTDHAAEPRDVLPAALAHFLGRKAPKPVRP